MLIRALVVTHANKGIKQTPFNLQNIFKFLQLTIKSAGISIIIKIFQYFKPPYIVHNLLVLRKCSGKNELE